MTFAPAQELFWVNRKARSFRKVRFVSRLNETTALVCVLATGKFHRVRPASLLTHDEWEVWRNTPRVFKIEDPTLFRLPEKGRAWHREYQERQAALRAAKGKER